MEGLSDEYNEIYLEFQVDNLVTAYRSAQAAKSVKLKLTKKHVPCLTLEVELVMFLSYSYILSIFLSELFHNNVVGKNILCRI